MLAEEADHVVTHLAYRVSIDEARSQSAVLPDGNGETEATKSAIHPVSAEHSDLRVETAPQKHERVVSRTSLTKFILQSENSEVEETAEQKDEVKRPATERNKIKQKNERETEGLKRTTQSILYRRRKSLQHNEAATIHLTESENVCYEWEDFGGYDVLSAAGEEVSVLSCCLYFTVAGECAIMLLVFHCRR